MWVLSDNNLGFKFSNLGLKTEFALAFARKFVGGNTSQHMAVQFMRTAIYTVVPQHVDCRSLTAGGSMHEFHTVYHIMKHSDIQYMTLNVT